MLELLANLDPTETDEFQRIALYREALKDMNNNVAIDVADGKKAAAELRGQNPETPGRLV